MQLAIIPARAAVGIQAPEVAVEVHVAGGLPGLTIVGLPATAVREAKDRVRAALQSCGFKLPPRKVTVNLAPADLPKHGGRFDLAMALGILQASGQLQADLDGLEFLGELSLSGELRPVTAVLPAALAARAAGHGLVLPLDNHAEASLADGARIHVAGHLLELVAALNGQAEWPAVPAAANHSIPHPHPDLAEVSGQAQAKRALEIAATGHHNLLMLGPPGSGKSMLAQRLPGLCPPLAEAQALELASIRSSAGKPVDVRSWRSAPFRQPHHSASAPALVGGGNPPKPGEISLAHGGTLFLDELPEFRRGVLEALREPLETGRIDISRAAQQICYPARFQLIAAMNPCPCGYLGDASGRCHCSSEQVSRYRARISGPLLDRIDLHLNVLRVRPEEMLHAAPCAPSSAEVRDRVIAARQRQMARAGKCNAALTAAEMERDCPLDEAGRRLLLRAAERLNLSARALHRLRRVARSIADLADSESIRPEHLAEALSYRPDAMAP